MWTWCFHLWVQGKLASLSDGRAMEGSQYERPSEGMVIVLYEKLADSACACSPGDGRGRQAELTGQLI